MVGRLHLYWFCHIFLLVFPSFLGSKTLNKKCINANKTKSIFDFLSSSPALANELGQLKYYCMCCAKEHKESVCPNCGSKMKRAST
jgi:hypothetical protein